MDISSITKRQPLNPDDVLYLNGEKCIINSIKGTGTSSIVYEATLDGRKIILKELYPYGLGIFRNKDNSLIIPKNKENDFQSYKDGLNKAYQTQLNFHNDHKVRNFTVEPQKLYKHNNTLYVVMHLANGNSYDLIEPENVLSILEVGKALSKVISYYHEKGYLNLDIKPGNIFVFPETNQLIQLFDFNTVCTKEEASQGKFSYSEGYAAPEVRAAKKGSGKFSEVREQADIYSIGAVIFEKIMGRIPKASDQRAGKRWKLENNPYLKDAVPQLQKGIIDLFRKTLAIDKNDRYSSAKELISDLEKIIKFAGIEVFLKNQRISPCTPKDIYISRKDILSKISKALDEKHILYLHALGGSGKSETAREYAEQCTDKYDFIQSVFYSDSLKKTIANLDFVGLEDKDRFAYTDEDIDRLYKYKYGLLGNAALYGTNTLLIIDNYDYNVDPTSEEYQQNYKIIRELKKLNIHILFTTRVKPEDDTECLDLENMSEEELQTLFFRINPKDKNDPDRIEQVKEIIEVSYKHTMTVKLVAMQSAKYLKPLSEYINILKTSGLNSGIKGRVTNEKDDESVTMSTVYDHIKALFDFERLSEKQRYIMVNACLLPLSGLETAVFSKYIDLEHFDGASDSDCLDESIEDLINSGWIAYADPEEKDFTSDTKITLHPLICDIARNELEPELTDDKCRKFYESFLDLIDEWGNGKNENIRKTIYVLFPDLNKIFNYAKISEVLNYLLFSHDRISIQNHMILSGNELIMYFGIDTQCIIPNSVTEIGDSAFKNCTSLTQITIPNSVTVIDGWRFSGCTSLTQINIPNSVTEIGTFAFENCTSLTQINIPDSVIYIGDFAFADCTSFTQVTIPDSVIEIGDGAFEGCISLTQITIPNSVTEIGCKAFENCTSLKQVTIPNSVSKIGWSTFSDCKSLTQITIPNSVSEIEHSAFEGCTSLTQIIIPNSVTEIGWSTFSGCTSLTQIDIPNSVTEIEPGAFEGCVSLTQITIPNSVTEISYATFAGCTSLTQITIPNSVTEISHDAFEGCSSLVQVILSEKTKFSPSSFKNCPLLNHLIISGNISEKSAQHIKIPNSVTKIEDHAFSGYTLAISVTIPNSVIYIGNSAFEECESLTQINIPNSVIYIGYEAFRNCTSLTKIIIPDSVTEIGSGAFRNCKLLTQIIIPNSVTAIGDEIFENCRLLTQITISNSVTIMGNGVFKNCTSLKRITISDSITVIKDSTFKHCTSLVHIVIPNSVTIMGNDVFKDCTSLTQVTIPNSVTEIGDGAFEGCISLTQIFILANVMSIRSRTFFNCTSLKQIIIPNSVTVIADYAFSMCTLLTHIIIPSSVTVIGNSAFKYCESLTEITIPDKINKIYNFTFSNCISLKRIKIPDGVTYIGDSAFAGCISLKQITIPNSVTVIDGNAFEDCTSLTQIIIPESVTRIGGSAFKGCTSITQITLSNRITKIEPFTFAGCTSLTHITIPGSVTELGRGSFLNCTSFTQITIPDSITKIGKAAFEGCNSLGSVIVFNSKVELSESLIGYYTDQNGLYQKSDKLIIESYKGSTAEQYAQEHGFKFVPLD